MRHIIIGDIHGCYEELKDLLRAADPTRTSRIISLGDVVNKGEKPNECVKLLAKRNAVIITGNHEIKALKDPQRYNVSDESVEILRNSVPFYQFVSQNKKFTCLHAGIPLKLYNSNESINEFNDNDLKRLSYTRFINEDNLKEVTLGKEGVNSRFWAELYKGNDGFVLFGHQIGLTHRWFDHALGIDTGCVFGGRLTAAIVEKGNIMLFSVKSKRSRLKPYSKNFSHLTKYFDITF